MRQVLAGETARVMVLAGGQTAHIWLRLTDVANLPKAQCRRGRRGWPAGQPPLPYGRVRISSRWPSGSAKYTPRPPSLVLICPGWFRPGSAQ